MTTSENKTATTAEKRLQLVTFRIGPEEYGIDILKVREINRVPEVTGVPQAPDYVDGVANLRGKVIPIINTRRKFGLEEQENDKNTRIVVADVNGEVVGLVVDSVSEVLRIPHSIVEPPPNATINSGVDYITGVVRLDDRLLILLDPGRLVGDTTAVMPKIS